MTKTAAVIGAGPAGLMAAEVLSAGGMAVTVYDRMPSVGRKFLMAGRGGLNLTHSERPDIFFTRYGPAAPHLRPMLQAFPPLALTEWANTLGAQTFTGSSGRIFPKAMKASPLLRAWLARLNRQKVQFRLRHEWRGWSGDALGFHTPAGDVTDTPDVTVLALGGASWPRLGANGGWTTLLQDKGVAITPLRPANMGFNVAWSELFRTRFAGQPLKNVALRFGGHIARGDAMITRYGLEGGAVYALSAVLRDALATGGTITLDLDLRPDLSQQQIASRLSRPQGKDSLANFLRKAVGLSPLESNLLRETGAAPDRLKSIPLTVTGAQPLARAISTAGGVSFDALDDTLQLKGVSDTYAIGEMLDWEAPTGGYLLQACFSTAVFAARAILSRIAS
ncbi:MAG: TIGR03862 family flavoprotein [Alphaproteobacteria bacterium]|nr:TIGR03862 family flavoprotein [Alphaproteobacteria bacterium]MBL6937162.1 TIGR03862 family flavoprotein [Alphaproteobacteria bacterium]MBL7096276.1 TIGR03862 family flavoprotein [Alphaproteobacteria bacterium]